MFSIPEPIPLSATLCAHPLLARAEEGVILIFYTNVFHFMSQDNFCKKCGAAIDPTSAFCPKCGAQVGSQAPSQPPNPNYVAKKDDRLGPFIGGSILIWLGLSFFFAQTNVISWAFWWAYFMIGLGAILAVFGLFRWKTGAARQDASGMVIGGLVVAIIGAFFAAASAINFGTYWPFLLVAIGIIVIIAAIVSGRLSR